MPSLSAQLESEDSNRRYLSHRATGRNRLVCMYRCILHWERSREPCGMLGGFCTISLQQLASAIDCNCGCIFVIQDTKPATRWWAQDAVTLQSRVAVVSPRQAFMWSQRRIKQKNPYKPWLFVVPQIMLSLEKKGFIWIYVSEKAKKRLKFFCIIICSLWSLPYG